ncbi:MAG: hypothetical protein MJZ31_12450 [Bacteroidales bacterium]|nr:hypothetical protein [Bacteroidales bacterium]
MDFVRQLIRLTLIALTAATFMGCSSQEEKEVRRLYGKVVEAEGDSMLVVVAGTDTISMHRTNRFAEMPIVMDSVVLCCVIDSEGQVHVEDLIILNHNKPVLNNVTAMLIGTWQINDEDSELRQLSFDDTLKAQALKRGGRLQDVDWLLKGKNVIYGSGKSESSDAEQYRVVSVDAHTLTVSDQMNGYTFMRLCN